MNFRCKNYLKKVLSVLPWGEKMNYLFQRYISKKLPPTNIEFMRNVNIAYKHFQNFKNYNQLKINENKYFEFGAGWTLTIPICIAFLKFEVHCIDIRKLIIHELITDTLDKFKLNKNSVPFDIPAEVQIKNRHRDILNYIKNSFRIQYYAPMDARNTIFERESFDFISSTSTLEHLPETDIRPILEECYRIMKGGGIFSIIIDYQDHWAYFDKNISIYNYLKYSSKEWKKFNPTLHYQNRLRHSDYLKIISQTDFKVLKILPHHPSEEDLDIIREMKLADKYLKHELIDLGIRGAEIVLTK